jgi:hypothetical protein
MTHPMIARIAPVLPVLTLACSDGGTPSPRKSDTDPAALSSTHPAIDTTLRRSVRVGESNAVGFEVLPHALCQLDDGVRFATSDDGFGSFFATPQVAGVTRGRLACDDAAGRRATYSIELVASPDAPVLTLPLLKGAMRPALAGDPMAPTQDELRAMGYPSRPDAVTNPEHYALWLRAVSHPATVVSGRPVAAPGQRGAPLNTGNWAGYGVRATGSKQYTNVATDVYVPIISRYDAAAPMNIVSYWTGLGGFGSNGGGMFQGGIQVNASLSGSTIVATTNPWIEFINASGPCCTMQIWSFQPNPRDEMFFEFYYGFAGNPGPSGIASSPDQQYLWYLLEDITQQWVFGWSNQYDPDGNSQGTPLSQEISDYEAAHPNSGAIDVGITGGSAEWIVERVDVPSGPGTVSCGANCNAYPLANFSDSPRMFLAQAYDHSTNKWIYANDQPGITQIQMNSVPANLPLATANLLPWPNFPPGSISLNWVAFE